MLASKADFEDRNFGYDNEDNIFEDNAVFVNDSRGKERFPLVTSFVQDGSMIIDDAIGKIPE